ncbi:glycosyltransferase family 4 protein [Balneolales bacterium ANBcel1]|nr:glycosyltransferase family 4 protein [Balneolales bacterium ANBcel1]
MRILFITDNFPPEVNAPATRTYEHCREWVRMGANVTVITCFPNFPQGKVYEGYKNQRIRKERIEGIDVIRVWSYITPNEGFVRRTVDYMSFAMSAFFAGLTQKPDVIIATSPQFFTTWTGFALSLIKRKPWVFELRDLWPESIKSVGAIHDGFLYRFLEKIELFLYRKAHHIIPNTYAFGDNLVGRGIPEEKISVIPNGANLELFDPGTDSGDLRDSMGLGGKFVIGYIGTHGMAHALDFVIRSIVQLQDTSIHFIFIGDGAMKKHTMQLAEDFGLDNVTFLDPVPKNDMPRYLALVDASLAPLIKTETFKTVIPSKIFEAGAMGKPMLLGVDGQARSIVEEHGSGLYFEPENTEDFIARVKQLAGDPELQHRLGEGGKKLARAFDRKKLASEMLDVLDKVAQPTRTS